jgi:predicted nuclease of predicted toxin-antitoxin system
LASVRFHLDEHQSSALARALRRFGIDVETTSDAGLIGASDEAHARHAQANGRVIVTDDSDFKRLHVQIPSHSGIVYFPGGGRPIGEMVESLRLIHAVYSAEEMVGRLEYL